MSDKKLNVGVIGFGVIGTGVVKVLVKDQKLISKRAGIDIRLKSVADLKFDKKKDVDFSKFNQTKEAMEIINDPAIGLIVEVIGGVKPAKQFIEAALKNKKHVVTANKELIAKHGKALITLAKKNNVNLFFEASAGGGIPIIQALTNSLAANNVRKIFGILNGTTNYILSKMYNEGADLKVVLKEAQKLGYAEANPSADIEGDDVAYKLSILSTIAFDSYFNYKDIYKEGITKITARDIEIAKEFGSVIKLLAIGVKCPDGGVELRVHPVMINKNHPLAAVNGAYNAVYVIGNNVGETMFYGSGAGELPTASAIVGDIVEIARHIDNGTSLSLGFGSEDIKIKDIGSINSKYFIRMLVNDEPGVLADISAVFGKHKVSIKAVQQKETYGIDAEIVIITHSVKESAMQAAITEIKNVASVKEVASILRAGI